MAANKEVKAIIKLQIEAGKANPAPPVGPALGQHGVNIMDFCKAYNDKTKDKMGQVIPVEIYVYADNSFDFKLKTAPASAMIRKAAGIQKGANMPGREVKGRLTKDQVREIAKEKMEGLNANDVEQAMKIIEGSARSMGVEIKR